jgi:hypothetical protein
VEKFMEGVRPHAREMLQFYMLNEELEDGEIVGMMLERYGTIASEKRLRTIVRWCRAARKGDGKKYIDLLSRYLGLPNQVIREELELGYKIRVGRGKEVYECLLSLGGVATTKELQKALGWDPNVLGSCLNSMRRRGLLIDGERRFIRNVLPDFTGPSERSMVWYVPERENKAKERAGSIALERLESSFRSYFEDYYKTEKNKKEAKKLIPFLRKAYIEGSVFTLRDLKESSECIVDEDSLKKALQHYTTSRKSLYNYDEFFSFHKEKIEQVSLLDRFTESFVKSLFDTR